MQGTSPRGPVKNSAAGICRSSAWATPPRSARRARAPRRRTPRRDRRARWLRRACRGCGSGSARCAASTASAAEPIRRLRRPCPTQRVRRGRADPHLTSSVAGRCSCNSSTPGDVDEVLEVGQSHRQHRHQALSASEDLGVVAVLGEQLHRVRDACRVGGRRSALGAFTTAAWSGRPEDPRPTARRGWRCGGSGAGRRRKPTTPAAAAAATTGPNRLATGRATTLSRSTESPASAAGAAASRVAAARAALSGAAPPSSSASRLLGELRDQVAGDVGQHAAAELCGLAGDGQVGGDDDGGRVALVLELRGHQRPPRCRCPASPCPRP